MKKQRPCHDRPRTVLGTRVHDEVTRAVCQLACPLGRDGAGEAGGEPQGGEGLAE